MVTFILLCISSLFIKNKFTSNFSLIENYKTANHYNPNLCLHFDGLKFFVLTFSTATHSMVLLGILFAQPYAPVKESEFSAFFSAFFGRFIKAVDVLFFYRQL